MSLLKMYKVFTNTGGKQVMQRRETFKETDLKDFRSFSFICEEEQEGREELEEKCPSKSFTNLI